MKSKRFIALVAVLGLCTVFVGGCGDDNGPNPDPKVVVAPDKLSFDYRQGGLEPPDQVTSARTSGGGETYWQVNEDSPWLTITPKSSQGSDITLTVGVDPHGLEPGRRTATVEVQSADIDGPGELIVELDIRGDCASIVTNCDGIEFRQVVGGSRPDCRTCNVSSLDADTLRSVSASTPEEWFSVETHLDPSDPSSFTFTVCIDENHSLLPGSYRGYVFLSISNACDQTIPIPVVLEVVPEPEISTEQSSFEFEALQDRGLPSPQTLTVYNCGGDTLKWSIEENTSWLTVSPVSGRSNSEDITLTATSTNLSPGTHKAQIIINSPNASNSSQTVEVIYKVTGPILSVSTSEIKFRAPANPIGDGSLLPDPKEIEIANEGGGTLKWEVLAPPASWLVLDPPTSGSSNLASVTVQITRDDLPPGRYTAYVKVTSDNAENTPDSVKVIYDVIGPKLSVEPRQIHIIHRLPCGFSIPEPIQTIRVCNDGGGLLEWTATPGEDWLLQVVPTSGVLGPDACEQVHVTVNPAVDLSPGVYWDRIVFEAEGAEDSPQVVEVTVEVIDAPPESDIEWSGECFEAIRNGPAPDPQPLIISNVCGGILEWTGETSADWFALVPSSGQVGRGESQTVDVVITRTDLDPGIHQGIITIYVTGENSPEQVAVCYIVSE